MKKKILLADDSVTIRKVVELTFMGESFELISVGSGTEAIDQLDSNDGLDLVIADVHMPGADGYEVCREVKKRSPSTPVLLLVGTFETFEEQQATDAGADEHLKKPFDSQDLLGRVHELLAGSNANAPTVERPAPAAAVDMPVEAEVPVAAPTVAAAPAHTPNAPVAPARPAPQAPLAPSAAPRGGPEVELSEESVDRIARRVVELLSEEAIREVAWDVIPDLAEIAIKERLDKLESQVE